MKRALLLFAKERFSSMRSSHDQLHTRPSYTLSQLAAPISPTPNLVIETFLPRLNLDSNSFLVDLGCGDGRWLIAAHEYAKCRCLGIDVDEERLVIAQKSILTNKLHEVIQVRKKDVFEFVKEGYDICAADVIVMYLFREAMIEIGTLLQQHLLLRDKKKDKSQKMGQILSVGFALPGWTPVYEDKIGGMRVYLYSTLG
jgi:SAM-dependent methyltransferase